MVARARIALLLALHWALMGLLFGLRGWGPAAAPLGAIERFPTGVLRVGIDPSYPPFAAHTVAGFAGLDIELGEALAAELGIPLRFVPLGYDGLYDALRTESIDVLLAGVRINFRQSDDVIYSQPYLNGGLMLLSPRKAPLMSRSELPGHVVAYAYGAAADRYLWYAERELPPFQRAPYEDVETALVALRRGRAAAALVDGTEGRLFLREHGDWAEGVYLTDDFLAVAMRRDRPLIHEVVNAVLARLLADGRLGEILARWL